jgi:AraC-like DNA-binding protein
MVCRVSPGAAFTIMRCRVLSLPMPDGIRYKTVSAEFLHLFMPRVLNAGMSEAEFLSLTGITAADLRGGDGRLAGDKHLRILSLCERLPLRIADFPCSLDALYSTFPELAALWANCRTPREGVDAYAENRCLLGEVDFVRLAHDRERITLDYVNEAGVGRSAASALGNFNIVRLILRHLLDGAAATIHLELQGDLGVSASELEQGLGVGVRLGQPRNRLCCVSAALDAPYPRHNPLTERYLQERLAGERQRLAARRSFMQQVGAVLEARMRVVGNSGDCEHALADVCRHFGISRWTLLRRLKEEECTFASLWTRVRATEAKRLLLETDRAIAEISDRLGFISQSSLSRFFRAQWGVSPLQFRARHGR